MGKRIQDVLDTCIDRVLSGRESVEQCLGSYPEQAAELEPLLRAALEVGEISSIRPGDEFQRVGKARLLAAVNAQRAEKTGKRVMPWALRRGWVVAISVVLALAMAGGGTVMASSGSLPGDVLYPVKTATERVQGFFTFGDEAKAGYHIRMAERRLEEIEALVKRSRTVPAAILPKMNAETDRALELLSSDGRTVERLAARVVSLTSDQKAVLVRIERAEISLDVRALVREAFERSEEAHIRATTLQRLLPEVEDLDQSPWGGDRLRELWPELKR